MKPLAGIGKKDRERLSAVLRANKGALSVTDAANALGISRTATAKMLARWAEKGWLSRIRQGFYVPVPLESRTADVPLEDPWVIAFRLYGPCYIAGWSAAEYWDLTEQIFRTVVVMTTQRPRERKPNIKGTDFLLRSIPVTALFGLKPVWRGKVKVEVSDLSRTVLDMLSDPQLGGGIRSTVDMFGNYLRSEKKDLALLLDYASRLGNGAVFKRLGYLLERMSPDDKEAIAQCRANLTTGNAKLDPRLPAEKLITRWRLWVPAQWAMEWQSDR
jgi:predicted transcriptional regulator of viral defense system